MGREKMADDSVSFPPYAFVPGGPWPHPTRSPDGHSYRSVQATADPITGDDWAASKPFRDGVALFNEGYYWEAHEAWESLWHAHGRRGPIADVLKGLIKLAAAGVKVRECQPHGVITHARRAGDLFAKVRREGNGKLLGFDLAALEGHALAIIQNPPTDPAPKGARVSVVFGFKIEPIDVAHRM